MKTMKEIETRLAQIAAEVETDGADLDALEAEARSLKEARQSLLDAAEKRSRILADVSTMTGKPAVETPKAETRSFDDMDKSEACGTTEYRNAFAKYIKGRNLTDVEARAFYAANHVDYRTMTTSKDSVGAAVPTTLYDQIITKLKQICPLVDELNMMYGPGTITIAIQGVRNAASKHAEGATIAVSEDTLVDVSLFGYEMAKLLKVSKSADQMSISSLENYLSDNIAESLSEEIHRQTIYGTGNKEATGIDTITWNASNSVTIAANADPTAKDILNLISLLPGGYDRGAKMLMSKRTLIKDLLPLQDKSKNDLVVCQGGTYYILGYPVILSDYVTEHELYLGNFKKYAAKMDESINVNKFFEFKENSYYYGGYCIYDGKPAIEEAFTKLIKAKAAA